MYSGINKLMPGHMLELDQEGKLSTAPYWDLTLKVDEKSRPSSYYVETYRELLEQAVSSHLMSDVPLGMFLSGGLDSSAVAALATRIRGDRIETFAVGYGEEEFSELGYAREVARHVRSDHHEVRLSREDFFEALPTVVWERGGAPIFSSCVWLCFFCVCV